MADAQVTCWSRWADAAPECAAGVRGAAMAFVIIVLLHTVLYIAARRAAAGRRPVVFLDMIVTGDDNKYSLSRLQVYLWTVVVIVTFAALSMATGRFAEVPMNLALLMSVTLGSAVAATALSPGGGAPAAPEPPGKVVPPVPKRGPEAPKMPPAPRFIRDLFFTSAAPGNLDLPRTQMFMWTLVILATWIVLFVKTFPHVSTDAGASATALPDIPTGLLTLMGVSNVAYLGAKKADAMLAETKPKPPAPADGAARPAADTSRVGSLRG